MDLHHEVLCQGIQKWLGEKHPDCAKLSGRPGGGALQPGRHHARGPAGLRRQPAAPEEPVRRCAAGCILVTCRVSLTARCKWRGTDHVGLSAAGSYLLEVFGADDTAAQAAIVDFAAAHLGAAPAEAPAGGRARFALPPGTSLPAVFRAVEAARRQLGIQTYSLSQPTLEQVFVNVVGGQLEAEADDAPGALEPDDS